MIPQVNRGVLPPPIPEIDDSIRVFLNCLTINLDRGEMDRIYQFLGENFHKFTETEFKEFRERYLQRLLIVSSIQQKRQLALYLGTWLYRTTITSPIEIDGLLPVIKECVYFLAQSSLYKEISDLLLKLASKYGAILADKINDFRRRQQVDCLRSAIQNLLALEMFCPTEAAFDANLRPSHRAICLNRAGLSEESQREFAPLDCRKPIDNNRCITEQLCQLYKDYKQSFSTEEGFVDPEQTLFPKFTVFFDKILNNAFTVIGDPPCSFELRLLGSMGRQEPSFSSDIELIFFVEQKDPEITRYFKILLDMIDIQLHATGAGSKISQEFPSLVSGIHLDRPLDEVLFDTASLRSKLSIFCTLDTRQQMELDWDCVTHSLLTSYRYHRSTLTSFDGVIEPFLTRPVLIKNLLWYECSAYSTNSGAMLSPRDIKKTFISPLEYLMGTFCTCLKIRETSWAQILRSMRDRNYISQNTEELLNETWRCLYSIRLKQDIEPQYVLNPSECSRLHSIHILVLDPLYKVAQSFLQTDVEQLIETITRKFTSFDLIKEAIDTSVTRDLILAITQLSFLDCEDFERYFRHLSLKNLPDDDLRKIFFNQISQNQTLANREELCQLLLQIPTPSGLRLETWMTEAALANSLAVLVTLDETPVRMVTASGMECYLRQEYIPRILNLKGKKIHSQSTYTHRNVASLDEPALHFKENPGDPFVEYAMFSLFNRLFGSCFIPVTDLIYFQLEDNTKIPVLVSQTIDGIGLHTLEQPIDWVGLSPQAQKQWTQAFLFTILTKPSDGKGANYIKRADNFIFCVDNELSLTEPFERSRYARGANFKSQLFFATENGPLHREALEEFCRLDPDKIILGWIGDLQKKEEVYQAYQNLFTEAELAAFNKDPTTRFRPTFLFRHPRKLIGLWQQFFHLKHNIQQYLTDQRELQARDLLKFLITSLPNHDCSIEQVGNSIYRRYLTALECDFNLQLARAVQKKTLGIRHGNLRPVDHTRPTLQVGEVDLQEDAITRVCSLQVACENFFPHFLHVDAEGFSISGINESSTFIKCNFQNLPTEKHLLILEQIINYIEAHRVVSTRTVLQNCDALTLETLVPFLHANLEELDISGCRNITGIALESISAKCHSKLRKLVISNCTRVTYIGKQNLLSLSPLDFQKLQELHADNCNLTAMKIASYDRGNFTTLIAHDNPRLEPATVIGFGRIHPPGLQAFGGAAWTKYLGFVDEDPSLPENIQEILRQPDVRSLAGETIGQTHQLILIPKFVNGRGLSLKYLQELFSKKTRLKLSGPLLARNFDPSVQAESDLSRSLLARDSDFGSSPQVERTHWILISKQLLNESTNKTYQDQCLLIEGPNNQLSSALETVILLYVLILQNQLNPQMVYNTRCSDELHNRHIDVVKSRDSDGFWIGLGSDGAVENVGIRSVHRL